MQLPFQLSMGLLSTYFRFQRRRVLLLVGILVGSIALQLINPQIVRYVLDTAQTGAALGGLLAAALLFMVFNLLQAGASLAVTYVGEDVSWTATNALRRDLAHHVLRLDMGFHNSRTPGELIERVDGDVSELANFFSQLVLRVLANGLLITGVIVLLFREDWRMGAAAAIYALLTLGALQAVQPRNVRYWSALRASLATLYGYVEERLAGREDVRANGGEGYVLRGLAIAQRVAYAAAYQAHMFGAFVFSLTHMLFVLATALSFGLGIYLFLNNQITIGTVYLIVYYVAVLREPLEQIRDQVDELQHSTASIQRIREFFGLQPHVQDVMAGDSVTEPAQSPPVMPSLDGQPAESRALAVRLENVSFDYRQSEPGDGADAAQETDTRLSTLTHVSFALEPGQILGLLGRTGSGKSTLTRLLFRLYDPDAGEIYLDNREIRTLQLATLRRQIGMVTQEVQLFQATLRDNITLFRPDVEDARILAVIEELGLRPWYDAQPDGLDTHMQSGGQGLSAGEAQLLAFVRVFLKNPGLIILDEASSRLDPATEMLLERATDRLLANRTGIVIAHRLRTVERADAILILEQGRVVESGPRANLAGDPNSRFYRLLQTGLENSASGTDVDLDTITANRDAKKEMRT